MKKSIFIFTVILHVLYHNISYAQDKYTMTHYTADNGLPQNSIKSITADGYGFIWLATEDGLVRFDGHRFYVFNGSNLGVKSNRILYIEPYERSTNPHEKPILMDGQTVRSYAHFDDKEAVRIEKGTAVLETLIYADIYKKMLPLDKALHFPYMCRISQIGTNTIIR